MDDVWVTLGVEMQTTLLIVAVEVSGSAYALIEQLLRAAEKLISLTI